MLQFYANSIDVRGISEILAKYSVKASISNSVITLKDNVSAELLSEICNRINIRAIRNFIDEEAVFINEIASESEESTQNGVNCFDEYARVEYDLIYPKVKRGEVYFCEFGNHPYGSEQGKGRYAIVVQNDKGNLYSPTTIVLPCTTEHKKMLPVHYNFTFSSNNMIDYNFNRVGSKKNIILAEQIRVVDKRKLRKYLGTLTSDFMEIVDNKIKISLALD